MSSTPQSAVLVTIDSLRFDRLGVGGADSQRSPTLDWLARTGQWHTRAYANSWYTQFSFPSLPTSTYPLDCGGYDRGVARRQQTLAAAFRARGFNTAGFSTDPYLNAYYGYDRGFDAFFELFDVSALWEHVCRDYVAHDARRLENGELDRDQLQARVEPMLRRLLAYITGYYTRKVEGREHALSAVRSPLYRRDFAADAAHMVREQDALTRDPRGYVDTLLGSALVTTDASGRDGVEEFLAQRSTLARIADRLDAYSAKRVLPTVDAHDVVSLAETWIGKQGNSPFFAWVSLNDVHDLNFTHQWISLDTVRYRWRARSAKDVARLKADLALQFVDKALKRLLAALERTGQLDSTLIVVCSDHGRIDGASPFAGMFSDALMRVPLMFWHAGMTPRTIAHPCSLLDVAPTMFDLMALEAESAFRGLALGSAAAVRRPHIVVEQLGGGPCDLERRLPVICLVGREYKYAWSPSGEESYNDLAQRPRQGSVPVHDASTKKRLTPLRSDAERRYGEILDGLRRLHSNL